MSIILIWLIAAIITALIFIAVIRGYAINLACMLYHIAGALVDVACQAWLDIRKLWGKQIELDEHERRIS